MKIACLIYNFLSTMGGAHIFLYNLMTRLSQRGETVDLYLPWHEYRNIRSNNMTFEFEIRPLFYGTSRVIFSYPFVLKPFVLYRQFVNRYDLWQVVGSYPMGYIASILAGNVPLVLRTFGEDIQKDITLNYGMRLDFIKERRIIETLKKMDVLVALSQSIVDCYEEIGIKKSKIVEIPNAVDLERFKRSTRTSELRERFKIPANIPLIITVGRNHPKKGYLLIPEIASKLKNSGLSFLWLIVGIDTELLMPSIRGKGVEDVVITFREIGISRKGDDRGPNFNVPDDNLVDLYKAADIFAFPSLLESFGLVLIEAMAAGLAIVTTDAPGCRDVCVHEHNALQAKVGDADDFFRQLSRVLVDEGLKDRLIKNALIEVKRFDWEIVLRRYLSLYSSLIGKEYEDSIS